MIKVAIVLIIVIVLSHCAERKNNKVFVFLSIVLLSLLSGLRRIDVGIDTYNYYDFFYEILGGGYVFSKDLGFLSLSRALLIIFGKPELLMLCYAFITNTLIIIRLWKYRDNASYSLMMYGYISMYYFQSFNITRQMLAMSIVFCGSLLLEHKKYLLYFGTVLIGSSIHLSCILSAFVLLVFLHSDKSINKKARKMYWLAIMLSVPTIFYIISSYSYKYIEYFAVPSFSFSKLVILQLLGLVLILLVVNKKSLDQNRLKFFKSNTVLFATGLLLTVSGLFFRYMDRIGLYEMIYELPFWGFTATINNEKNRRFLMVFAFSIMSICLISSFVSNGSRIFPYHTFFDK